MQEQAAQLRAQQDKLAALSQKVLKYKGYPASVPATTSTAHLSPPPVDLSGVPAVMHRQEAHPGACLDERRDCVRASNCVSEVQGDQSSNQFTIRCSSRIANQAVAHERNQKDSRSKHEECISACMGTLFIADSLACQFELTN